MFVNEKLKTKHWYKIERGGIFCLCRASGLTYVKMSHVRYRSTRSGTVYGIGNSNRYVYVVDETENYSEGDIEWV